MSRLERFKVAQNQAHAGFASALEEIRAGAKVGHWIWYIFPQLGGLGSSSASRAFAIDGEEEAIEYLRDPELRSRLLTMTSAVAQQLKTGKARSLRALMGSDIDVQKLVSSLTLFEHVANRLDAVPDHHDACRSLAAIAEDVLAAAASEGYPACAYTLERLRRRE